jgi:uncharacterized repeat protein (TIGR03987 family)
MTNQLIIAIVAMVLALTCYSIGVWSEKFSGKLKVWHMVFFWIGFVFDTTGTTVMSKIAGKMELNIHGITGALAIFLMLSHAIWASVVLIQKREHALQNFHKFSLVVWIIWLVPFFSGMVAANMR